MEAADPIRLLLVGTPASEFRVAAGMARDAGAEVAMADTVADALAALRRGYAELVMVDVELDVGSLMAQLRVERFAVPVLACGIDAPAAKAVAAIRAGARDYLPLPPDAGLIAAAIASVIPRRATTIVGEDPVLRRCVNYALAMAPNGAALLINGERGTGKGLLARAIHARSGRTGPFVALECAGVAPEVTEAALFGHEAGAFAGAVARRLGRAEEAAAGTLFVGDIDCLGSAAQARLLEALELGTARRLGCDDALPFAARVIATSSRDLESLARDGGFRADLLARLSLVRVSLPPLRERAGDVPLLVHHLAERLALAHGLALLPFTDEALVLMRRYAWPCNVQELEDVVHRALLLATGPAVGAEAIVLSDGSRMAAVAHAAGAGVEALVGRTVEDVERALILQTLERCHGNRTCASTILGISVRTMRNKLKTFIEAGITVAPAA